MTEPSAEERAAALRVLKEARGWQMEYDLPPRMREGLVDAIAAALHAHAEAVRAELGTWSADPASRYAQTRVENVAARVDRWCDVRLGANEGAEHPAGCASVFHRIAAAIRAGATEEQDGC